MVEIGPRDIPTIPSEYLPDLEWSFRPIVLWMRMLGIPMDRFHSRSSLPRYAFLCVGITVMVWMGASDLFFITHGRPHRSMKINSAFYEGTRLLLEIYRPLNSILTSLSFFIVVHTQWKSLWKIAIEIENNVKFDATFYRSLRTASFVTLALLAVVKSSIRIPIQFSHYYFPF